MKRTNTNTNTKSNKFQKKTTFSLRPKKIEAVAAAESSSQPHTPEMTPEKGDIVQLREGFNGWAGLLSATVVGITPHLIVSVPGHAKTPYTISITDVKAILYTAKDGVFHC